MVVDWLEGVRGEIARSRLLGMEIVKVSCAQLPKYSALMYGRGCDGAGGEWLYSFVYPAIDVRSDGNILCNDESRSHDCFCTSDSLDGTAELLARYLDTLVSEAARGDPRGMIRCLNSPYGVTCVFDRIGYFVLLKDGEVKLCADVLHNCGRVHGCYIVAEESEGYVRLDFSCSQEDSAWKFVPVGFSLKIDPDTFEVENTVVDMGGIIEKYA